jgi:hypothetical protein
MEVGAMNRIATAVLICIFCQSIAGADELVAGLNLREVEATTLSRAITVEAARLARSATLELRAQSGQVSNKTTDTRPWCVRHGTGCFALIGYAVGFIGGLMHPADDFVPEGWALVFSGPIGAGIGAAVGWCIAEGTKPQPKPQQQP